MAQALSDIIGSLNAVYDPQRQTVQQQIDQLPGFFQAQQAGLDATKTNAFSDITNQANNRGVLYSGVPIEGENRYVGEKYLPAVASLKQDQANKTFALQDSLNKIQAEQYNQAYGIQGAQQKAEADYAAKIQAAQITAASRASSRGSSTSAAAQQKLARRNEYDAISGKIQDLAASGQSYGAVAQTLRSYGLNPSNFDQALRSVFVPANYNTATHQQEINSYLAGY